MKDWSGSHLCFECAKKIDANINIGRQFKGRCQRCHSEQTLFKVKEAATVLPSAKNEVCPECAHPRHTHAATCTRSEAGLLRREREEIVDALEETVGYDPARSLAEQIRQALKDVLDSRARSGELESNLTSKETDHGRKRQSSQEDDR